MSDEAFLKGIWEDLSAGGDVSRIRRIGNTKGLAQYCGIDGAGRFAFYTKTNVRPDRLEQLATLSVAVIQDEDARWTRVITLLDGEFFDEFSILVASLVAEATDKPSDTLALRAQGAAYEQWLSFYKRRHEFSLNAARGLFGEIFVLEHQKRLRDMSWGEALESWKGPFGHPQDFLLDRNTALEVKTVNTTAKRVKINGSDQLSFPGALTLTVLSVRDSSDPKAGESLISALSKIRSEFTRAEKDLLKERLHLVGFDPESESARSRFFELVRVDNYDVRPGFPRIEVSSLPEGVEGIHYDLRISALEKFKKSEE